MAEFVFKEKKAFKEKKIENRTGIPAQLKKRMEQSMGLSFDVVQVHYNLDKPAKLGALGYTQRNQVEIAPDQERHLSHEPGYVVQQKLRIARANAIHSSGVAMNTDAGLERQVDEIGERKSINIVPGQRDNVVQRCGSGGDSAQKKYSDYSSSEIDDDPSYYPSDVPESEQEVEDGLISFEDIDWKGYPSGVPKPSGPFRIVEGDEYEEARKRANAANKELHDEHPEWANREIHDVHPIKFGGDPEAPSNKFPLSHKKHQECSNFWNRVRKDQTVT